MKQEWGSSFSQPQRIKFLCDKEYRKLRVVKQDEYHPSLVLHLMAV